MEIKKRSKGLYVIITVLCVLVLALVIYIICDKSQNSKDSKLKDNNTNSNTNNLVSKLDSSRDWIYEAEYEKNVNATSYSTESRTYYAKDIAVPFINVNSSYADSSNKEIKSVLDTAVAHYNNGVNDKTSYVDECNYKKYIYNNALSIILTNSNGGTSIVHPEYYTYNIDLKTGNKLSFEEVYKIAGFKSDTINSKVEGAITTVIREKLKNFNYSDDTNFDTYNSNSINNYKNSVNDNTIRYFLSDNNKLNVIVKLIIPADTGEFDTIITID